MNATKATVSVLLLAAVQLVSVGCRRSAPAPAVPEIPAGVSIAVEVNGQPQAPLDARRLREVPADQVLPEGGLGWKLDALLAAPLAAGTNLELDTEDGERTLTVAPSQQAVLFFNRREEVVVVLKAAGEAGAFHGRGGNRGRSGDATARVRGVYAVRVRGAEAGVSDGAPAGGGVAAVEVKQ